MHKWKERSRPLRLEKRFEFTSYEMTRDFLDKLGELCEKKKRFPDISFGKTYVNLTLQSEVDDNEVALNELDEKLASEIDQLIV